MRRIARSAPIPGIILLGACAGGAEGPANPHDIDQASQLALVEELRLGSFDDPDQGFSQVRSVDVDRDGNLFVFEGSESAIRVYSPDGRLLRRIGREGEGPGEFSGGMFSFVQFGVTGDTVWTIDRAQSRLSLFDRQGELISARRYAEARVEVRTGWVTIAPTHMRPDGTFVGWANSVRYSRDDDGHSETRDDVPIPRIRFGSDGQVLDTIGWTYRPPPRLVVPSDYQSTYESIEVKGSRYTVPSPPSILPNWYGRMDGFISVEIPHPDAEQGRFFVTKVDLEGDTVFHNELVYAPRLYSDEDLDAIAFQRASQGNMAFIDGVQIEPDQDPEQIREATNQLRARMNFPSHMPAVGLPRPLNDGSLWFQRQDVQSQDQSPSQSRDQSPGQRPGESPGETRWIVVRSDGTIRGEARLPSQASPLWYDGETLWVSEPDDFEVPWLVRYRIQG